MSHNGITGRRNVLKAVGGTLTGGALAGCTRGGGDGGAGGGGGDGSGGDGGDGGAQHQMILGHATKDDAQDNIAQTFVDEVNSRSDGRIEAENFNASQLGNNQKMNQDTRSGAQHALVQPAGFAAPYAAVVGVLDLPFLFPADEYALQMEVLNGDAMQVVNDALRGAGVEPVTWYPGGWKHLITKFPVETADDLEDRKFRVIQSPELIAQFEAWGAVAVGMALGEVYSALQQGTVEGVELPPDVTDKFKYQEVTQQMTLTSHGALSSHIVVNKDWLDGLPSDLQDAVRGAGQAAADASVDIVNEFQSGALETLRGAEGFEVTEMADAELQTLEERGQAAYERSRENEDKASAIDALTAAIESQM